jgi:two-component system sensor histidine kinase UhpB
MGTHRRAHAPLHWAHLPLTSSMLGLTQRSRTRAIRAPDSTAAAGAPASWRARALDALWFGRSVRAQLLIVFILVDGIAALVAGGVTIFKASTSTRIEIAASMRLAELIVGEAVQLVQQGIPAEQLLRTLPVQLRSVRHVRIGVRDADGRPISDRTVPPRIDDRPPAPRWFAALIGPRVERQDVPVAVGGRTIGTVEIVAEPRDEIAEVWENTVALAAIAGATSLLTLAILYFVLGRVLDPLTALGKGLEALEHRDYRMRLTRPKVLEFAAITDRFNALAGALEAARAENLALSRRLLTAQDDERRRTALELHDEVGPSLFGLKANTASIAKIAASLPENAATAIAGRTGELTGIIEHLQSLNRRILNRLRPMALGHVPLPELLSELVSESAGSHSAIAFTCDVGGLGPSYGDTVDLTLYRCVQESLTNAIRHAGASAVLVAVREAGRDDAGARLELTVRDNGHGFPAGSTPGFGLRGMQERVQALGGAFTTETGAGGTSIRIVITATERASADGPDRANTRS